MAEWIEWPSGRDSAGFLLELAALTSKYGIKIDGCGCCGSPFLNAISVGESGSYAVSGREADSIEWKESE